MAFTLIEDTRQQANKHRLKHEFFNSNNIKVVRSKLPCGDYAKLTDLSVVIDTKKDIQEIVGNVTTQHARFIRECYFAQENDIHLIYLIEDERVTCIDDLNSWHNYRLKFSPKVTTGKQLAKILKTIEMRHDVLFLFCKKEDAGRKILTLLGGDVS